MISTMLANVDFKEVTKLNDESNNLHPEQQQLHSKLIHVIGEEKPSMLNFSSENLSVSQSIMEQGFNKNSLLGWQIINRHTILNMCAILLAISCVFFEIFKLPKVLENSKNIEILKRDLEILQQQLYDGGIDIWSDDNAGINEDNDYNNYDDGDDDGEGDDDDDEDEDDNYESDLDGDINMKHILRKTKSQISSTTSRSVDESAHDYSNESQIQNEQFDMNRQRNETASKSAILTIISSRLNDSLINKIEGTSITNSSNARSKRDTARNESFISLSSRDNMMAINIPHSSHSNRNGKKNNYLKNNLKSSVKKTIIERLRRESRMVFAAHYGADSNLFTDEDEHTGNGRFRHHEGIFKAWRSSDWMNDYGMDRYFSLNIDGKVTVHEEGLYLIYAQIHYLDEHDENGFHLLVNGRPILQCMVYSPGTGHKSRSCFSAQITLLHNEDRIILKDIGTSRYTLFQKDKSFFGLIRIGDIKHSLMHAPQLMENGG